MDATANLDLKGFFHWISKHKYERIALQFDKKCLVSVDVIMNKIATESEPRVDGLDPTVICPTGPECCPDYTSASNLRAEALVLIGNGFCERFSSKIPTFNIRESIENTDKSEFSEAVEIYRRHDENEIKVLVNERFVGVEVFNGLTKANVPFETLRNFQYSPIKNYLYISGDMEKQEPPAWLRLICEESLIWLNLRTNTIIERSSIQMKVQRQSRIEQAASSTRHIGILIRDAAVDGVVELALILKQLVDLSINERLNSKRNAILVQCNIGCVDDLAVKLGNLGDCQVFVVVGCVNDTFLLGSYKHLQFLHPWELLVALSYAHSYETYILNCKLLIERCKQELVNAKRNAEKRTNQHELAVWMADDLKTLQMERTWNGLDDTKGNMGTDIKCKEGFSGTANQYKHEKVNKN